MRKLSSFLATQIRSFIKGSLEAIMQHTSLLLELYLDTALFGFQRCRLQVSSARKCKQYCGVLEKDSLLDDTDKVGDILNCNRLKPLATYNGNCSGDYHKVYVDEVQDNTQAKIVLYSLATGMNTNVLFIAGDLAESVGEGADFRFEDVRSIVYTLSADKEQIKLIVNCRGILA